MMDRDTNVVCVVSLDRMEDGSYEWCELCTTDSNAQVTEAWSLATDITGPQSQVMCLRWTVLYGWRVERSLAARAAIRPVSLYDYPCDYPNELRTTLWSALVGWQHREQRVTLNK